MSLQFLLDLQKKFFFKGLNMEEMKALFAGAQFRDVPNHKVLFSQGQEAQSFGVVLFGGFKIVKDGTKKEKTIIHFGIPGDLLGAMFMTLPQSVYSVSVIAMGPSAALEVSKKKFVENWQGNPKIQEKLNALFFNRIQEMQWQRSQTMRPLKNKIAALLIHLIRGESKGGSISIPLPITRQEIADFTGASVESVIRNLSSMSKMITTKDKSITILDLKALEQLASSENR